MMSKKPSKLSRGKKSSRRGEDKVEDKLNASDEDFQKPARPAAAKNLLSSTKIRSQGDENVAPGEISPIVAPAKLPPCPFCAKVFADGHDLARASHMKSCGSNLGVGVDDLLKIRQLEEKQAEEWRSMNLPKTSGSVSGSRTGRRPATSSSVAKKFADDFADPNLEMALALSASMAAASKDPDAMQEAKPNEGRSGGTVESRPPALAALLPPSDDKRIVKAAKTKAKTCLQVRTGPERERQISEQVALLLAEEQQHPRWRLCIDEAVEYKFGRDLTRKKLASLRDFAGEMWSRASGVSHFARSQYVTPAFNSYFVDRKAGGQEVDKISASRDESPSVADDWRRLLDSGEMADMTIYTRGEKPVKCHQLVLYARCRPALDEVIEEGGEKSSPAKSKSLIWSEVSAKNAATFLLYVYTGRLPAGICSRSQRDEFRFLAKKCDKSSPWAEFVADGDKLDIADEEQADESSQTEGGFLSQNVDANTATQNMDHFLDILGDVADGDGEDLPSKEDEAWDDMCELLSQKEGGEENFSTTPEKVIAGKDVASSPDLFGEDDERVDVAEASRASKKRKSSLSFSKNDDKRSRLDGEDLSVNFDGTVYSRQYSSPISIDLDGEDMDLSAPPAKKRSADVDFPHLSLVETDLSPAKSGDCKEEASNVDNFPSFSFLENADAFLSPEKVVAGSRLSDTKSSPAKKSPRGKRNSATPSRKTSQPAMSDEKTNDGDEFPHFSFLENADVYLSPAKFADNSRLSDTKSWPAKSGGEKSYTTTPSNSRASFSPAKSGGEQSYTTTPCKSRASLSPAKVADDNSGLSDTKSSPAKSAGEKSYTMTPSKSRASLSPAKITGEKFSYLCGGGDKIVSSPSTTPLKRANSEPSVSSPMPDYEAMLTPSLRRELRRFGLKAIPRRKAVPILRHIFDEMHPRGVADGEDNDLDLSQESDDGEDLPEESRLFAEGDLSPAKKGSKVDLQEKLVKFIRDDGDLHRACLLYEPVWLEDLVAKFKASTGVKCKVADVQDALDNECITFRTRARQSSNNRRNQKKS